MPLTVVKSLFQAGFFVASRRHAGPSFFTASSVSRAKSGSCSASRGSATGAAVADFSRSIWLIGFIVPHAVAVYSRPITAFRNVRRLTLSEARPSLLQKRIQPFLRLAGGEKQRERGALERVAAAVREELRTDVEREPAARAELECAVRDRARVELAEEVAPVRARAETPEERSGQRQIDRQRGALGDDEPVGEQVVRGDRAVGDRDPHRFLATSSSPGPN